MTELNKNICKLIGDEIEVAAKEIAKKYGLSAKTKGGSYSSSELNLKLSVYAVNNESANAIPQTYIDDYHRYGQMYGLKPEWINKEFNLLGETCQLVGLNTRRPKFCAVAIKLNTKKIIFTTPESVIGSLKTKE